MFDINTSTFTVMQWSDLGAAALCFYAITVMAVWNKPKFAAWRAGVAKLYHTYTYAPAHSPAATVKKQENYGRHAWNGVSDRAESLLAWRPGLSSHRKATRLNSWGSPPGVKIA